MKMDIVAGSGNDEFYTPRYAVAPILKYIPVSATVWCPFDIAQSHFVTMLQERGNTVIHSHKDDGQDFFAYEPEEPYSYIVSNPPYSLKNQVFKRLFTLGHPFAMLVGVVGLFESQLRFNMFKNNHFEIMYLNKRIAYFRNLEDQKPSLNPPFSSVYVGSGIFPRQIIFETVNK